MLIDTHCHLTSAELAPQLDGVLQRAAEKHERELNSMAGQRDYYRQLFEESTISRAIADAAAKHEAYDVGQFVALLSPKTKIVEEVSSGGEKTGNLVPKVEIEQKNEAGEIVTLLKTPEGAIEGMKDDVERYGNLFRSNVTRGIGLIVPHKSCVS